MTYTKEIFLTISTRQDLDANQLKKLRDYVQKHYNTKHLLVKETGKDGTHPHYHFYGHLKESRRINALTSQWKNALFKGYNLDTDEDRQCLIIKSVNQTDKLLGWYFQKEKTSQIMMKKDIDLDYYQKKWIETQKEVKYTVPKTITFRDAPYFMIKYMETKHPDAWESIKVKQEQSKFVLLCDVKLILGLMIRDNIAGHLLFSKTEDLAFALNILMIPNI